MTANNEALLAERPTADLARLRARWLVLCGIGLVGLIIGLFTVDRETFMQSYLIGFMFWSGITIGSMALLMVQYLSGGGWGLFARRVFEASARALPLLAILFVPIALSLPVLYPWARPDALADPKIAIKAAYLNPTYFYIRAAIYFTIWMGLTFTLTRWSKEQDDNPVRLPGPKDGRMRVLSGPGLVLYMLTITFMSVDWVMSLEPHFTSTIWGILTLGGQGLSTLAFTILVLAALSRFKPVSEVASEGNFHDLGKLMLAFVMLWAYFSLSQFLITWSGNLPEEITWYLARIQGGWQWVAIAIVFFQFVLPFVLLLSHRLKRRARSVAMVALMLIVIRFVDVFWLITPAFDPSRLSVHLLDLAAVLALGGFWVWLFVRQLEGRPLLPLRDPTLPVLE